jgi:hypothetical protein
VAVQPLQRISNHRFTGCTLVCICPCVATKHRKAWGLETGLREFFTSSPDGGEWSASRFSRFTPGKTINSTYWVVLFFLFLGVGWDWVHLVRRPLTGLLYQPRMIDDECGAVGGMRTGRGNRSTRRNLPQCHFVHHKHHMTWTGLEPGKQRWEAYLLGRRLVWM